MRSCWNSFDYLIFVMVVFVGIVLLHFLEGPGDYARVRSSREAKTQEAPAPKAPSMAGVELVSMAEASR